VAHSRAGQPARVSSTRALSTSLSSDIAHYHPAGELYTFQVPRNTFNEWVGDDLIQQIWDYHNPTGIVTEELKVMPPASGQLNQFLVK
jgi:hypothetical protein